PSSNPAAYYVEQYGAFGKIFYDLGFNDLYSSWWYLILIASIGVSLVICSLDRVVPLYRALNNQRVGRHESFLRRQRLYSRTAATQPERDFEVVKKRLKDKRYRIREENGYILAEKGRF